MKTFDITHIGKRSVNQDQVTIITKNDQQLIALVCDGMGGHNSGELASKIVCDYIKECFRIMPFFQTLNEAKSWLEEVIVDAHLLTKKQAATSPVHAGMGTTIVVALIYQRQILIANVGDSRCYYIGEKLVQLTDDDTFVNELVKSGVISKDEARLHPKRHVLMKAIGVSDDLEVHAKHYPLKEGYLLLCSDGLYNTVEDDQIYSIVKGVGSLKEKGDTLVDTALNQGGTDNISIALIEIEGRDLNDQ